jgi:F-type H+-transporting ATPase subunit b
MPSTNLTRRRKGLGHGIWRGAALALALSAAAPMSSAFAEDRAAGQAAAAEASGDDGHHGPFYTTMTFWGAVINFILLLLVLRRLASRPLSSFLSDRRLMMQGAIQEAAEMRQKAEALHREYTERLAQLDAELKKLREDIARSAEEDKQRIAADAEETARRLRSETEGLIDQHAKALSAGIRREVVEAAAAAAEQMLRSALNEGDQQRLADGFRQNLAGKPGDGRAAAERRPPTPRAEDVP